MTQVSHALRLCARSLLARASLLLTLLLLALAPSGHAAAGVRAATTNSQSAVYRNTAPGVGYVGSQKCASCHQDIYDEFRKTGMGQSMSLPSDPSQLAKVSSPVSVFDKKADRHFEVYRQGSDIYQTEYALDTAGKEVFRRTEKLDLVVGSGIVGWTYVIEKGHFLFQAPLSFYARSGTWELSPGYEFQDAGFNRPILSQCIACHSGEPAPLPASTGHSHSPFNVDPFQASDPAFHEMAIACESCHGPGQLHVEERLKAQPPTGDVDTAIVNPAKLPSWLANNICMNCHQAGDARVLKLGKTLFDVRPGVPLDKTLAIFQIPLTPESPPESPLLGHYYGMVLSKCYLASKGRLSCLSCHDPHLQPSAQQAPAYFRSKCLACHTEKSCKLSLSTRLNQKPADDCAGCHMPKRDLTVISHAALTDHRVVVAKGEPYPDAAFHMTTPALPDLVHLDAIPNQPDSIPAVTLLEAYAGLAAASPTYQRRYLEELDRASKTDPDDPFVLSALAQRALWERSPDANQQAIQYLSRAIERGSTYPADFLRLGELLARAGRNAESAQVLERGLRLAPYNGLFYQMLATADLNLGKYAEADDIAKKGLENFPDDPVLRELRQRVAATPQGR